MWSKTMVYSTTSTPEGHTELSIGDDSITVDVDPTTLDEPELEGRYQDLQSFSQNARSFQVLKHKLVFALFIFLPLVAVMMLPSIINMIGITGSGGLFDQVLWYVSLTVSAGAFFSACTLAVARSYYRYRVMSKLESEISTVEDEMRRRGMDIE